MALYDGPDWALGDVRIGRPDVARVRGEAGEYSRWFDAALGRDDMCYFSVYAGGELVGQILLHDVDEGRGEALVGYHVFGPGLRGRGIGARALALLQRFVGERTALRRLVIITTHDNRASRGLAEGGGFAHVGAPREDAQNGMVFSWEVSR